MWAVQSSGILWERASEDRITKSKVCSRRSNGRSWKESLWISSQDYLYQRKASTTILTVVDRLSKERHYIPCTAGEEGTSAEETAKLFLRWVYRTHGLPDSIVSDRGTQFVSLLWKSLCARLGISSNLSTAYHPQTDGQTERANQDVERYLRSYCNYMQDDWSTWLAMAEFADNNAQSSATQMTPFFLNKGFHPRMSFDADPTKPKTSRERLQMERAKDITEHMETALETAKRALQDAREAMIKSANKKRKEVVYNPGDLVFLSSRNIKTTRPSKKLDDKMLGPFKVLEAVGTSYRLQLPTTMRIHDVFHPSLLVLRLQDWAERCRRPRNKELGMC